MHKYSMSEIGVEATRNELIKLIGEARNGTIISVSKYEAKNGHGEIADFQYLKGVDYGKMKERSLARLEEISLNHNYSISVTRGVYRDADGVEHTRKAKGRTYHKVTKVYTGADVAFQEAVTKVRESLVAPKQQYGADYDKESNGVYSLGETLHIRDCQLLNKVVVTEGNYPETASGEVVAISDAIRRELPIGKYRQVCLDGRFDSITVEGQLVMQSEQTMGFFVGLKEHKGVLESRHSDVTPSKTPTTELV